MTDTSVLEAARRVMADFGTHRHALHEDIEYALARALIRMQEQMTEIVNAADHALSGVIVPHGVRPRIERYAKLAMPVRALCDERGEQKKI